MKGDEVAWAYLRLQENGDKLTNLVLSPGSNQLSRSVIEAAMVSAIALTEECDTPEATDKAILQTFWDAIGMLRKSAEAP